MSSGWWLLVEGPQHHGKPYTAVNQSNPTAKLPTKSTTYPNLEEGDADGAGMHKEVASGLEEPFLGIRFDTIESEEHIIMLSPQR
jgi:hypothetical protein